MSLDGMHFVLSRAALLDIFLMFWIVVAFYFLVLDREQRRARWLARWSAGSTRPARRRRPAAARASVVPAGLRRLARPRLRRQVERALVRAALRRADA